VRFTAAWQSHGPTTAHAPVVHELVNIFVPPDTTPGERWTLTPSDSSPSRTVEQIHEQPWPEPPPDALLLATWPPDTTKSEGALSMR